MYTNKVLFIDSLRKNFLKEQFFLQYALPKVEYRLIHFSVNLLL